MDRECPVGSGLRAAVTVVLVLLPLLLVGCFGPVDPLDAAAGRPDQTGASSTQPLGDAAINLLFIGDSLTAQRTYPNAVLQVLEKSGTFASVRGAIHARGGATPGQLLAMVEDGRIPVQPDPEAVNLAVIMAGTNQYRVEDLQRLVLAVNQAGFKVLVVCTPPRMSVKRGGWTVAHANKTYNDQLRKLYMPVQPKRLLRFQLSDPVGILVDPASRELDPKKQKSEWLNARYAADMTHLNEEGYTLWGQSVAADILRAFE